MRTRFALLLVVVLALTLSVAAFSENKVQKVNIKVEGMTCQGCVDKVKSALQKVEGVKEAEVSLKDNLALVTFDADKTNEKELRKAISSSGFKAAKGKDKACDSGGSCCGGKK